MLLRKYFLKTFMVLCLFSISYAIINIYVLYSQNEYFTPVKLPDLIRNTIKDLINYLDDTPQPENSIYFHKMTRQRALQLREACSIESAARAHPHREVNVVFYHLETDCLSGVLDAIITSDISNVHYHRLDLYTYAEGTPLQHIFAPRVPYWFGKWYHRKIRELVKFLTLYKFGGTVVDLDVMVVGSLDSLGQNWASSRGGRLDPGIISVSRGLAGKYYAQTFLEALKQQIAYDGVTKEESALKDALNSLCNTTNVLEMNREKCKGFRVYSDEFYNLDDGDIKATNTSGTYLGFHLWNETMEDHRTSMTNDSLYAILARMHCPVVYHGFMTTDSNSRYIRL